MKLIVIMSEQKFFSRSHFTIIGLCLVFDCRQILTAEFLICLQQVRHKNQQLKEIIDQIRTIIWEINTMITMRRT